MYEAEPFFSEFGFSSGWVDYLEKTKNIKIIHYPSTPQIYLNEVKKKYSLRGDLLFLNSFIDKKVFQKKYKKIKFLFQVILNMIQNGLINIIKKRIQKTRL